MDAQPGDLGLFIEEEDIASETDGTRSNFSESGCEEEEGEDEMSSQTSSQAEDEIEETDEDEEYQPESFTIEEGVQNDVSTEDIFVPIQDATPRKPKYNMPGSYRYSGFTSSTMSRLEDDFDNLSMKPDDTPVTKLKSRKLVT
jgi:cobalamin biosynthesis protein CobT